MREELTVNIAVCDDQGEWIEQVEIYLAEFRKIHRNIKWEAFYSAEELLTYIKINQYVFDVLITDIEMKKINGIELANKIRSKDAGVVIFFLSGHEEYIRQCFQPSPLNFWDKPLKYEQFKCDMEKAMELTKNNSKVFCFKDEESYKRVPYREIMYFKTNAKKIIAHTDKRNFEFYGSFKEYEKTWQDAGFVRASRFYYVNSEYVSELRSTQIILLNGEHIQSTPANMKAIKLMYFENDYQYMLEQMRGEE